MHQSYTDEATPGTRWGLALICYSMPVEMYIHQSNDDQLCILTNGNHDDMFHYERHGPKDDHLQKVS